MNKKEIQTKIRLLRQQITEANYNYHTLDKPTISDYEYDQLLHELIKLESANPELITSDSPTQKVGGQTLNTFKKVKHKLPMMSLSNQFSIAELIAFMTNINDTIPNTTFIFEEKLDGLAINLEYQNGLLINATTRGDGIWGEDVTNNVKTIKSIPHQLEKPLNLIVRGEIFMTLSTFKQLNATRLDDGLEEFANPRNATAGTIRQLDSKIVAKRNLSCNLYTLVNYQDFNLITQAEVLTFLKDLSFPVNKHYQVSANLNDVPAIIKVFDNYRQTNNYQIDGVVVKVNNLNDALKIGFTAKYPKGQTAYKFAPTFALTRLNKITLQVGRQGSITPVANFNATSLDGSTITKATLHNLAYIKEKDIREGDYIYIYKAGEIIPKVDRVELSKRDKNVVPYEPKLLCPICNSNLVTKENGIILYCPNELCLGQIKSTIAYFASRSAMNIMGLGEKIVDLLVDKKIITDIISIYDLKNKVPLLLQLEGFKEQKINNLLQEIENSKGRSFHHLITALGIKNVGNKTSVLLANHFKKFSNLKVATINELNSINEIGPEIAQAIYTYFHESKNQPIISFLETNGFNLTITQNENDVLSNYNILVTGTLEHYDRESIKEDILRHGATYSTSVSKKTTHLLVGKSASESKITKAKNNGIIVISEQEYEELKNNGQN